MATAVGLYLPHQVISGDLAIETGQRLVDVLNGAEESLLVLANGVSRSLHTEAPPVALGTVRVQRAQVLLVIPAEARPLGLRHMRAGYVEKRPLRARVALGPLLLTATLHFGPREPASFEGFLYDAGARFFIPATEANVSSQYRSETLEAPLVFVNRAAVDYGSLLEEAEEPSADDADAAATEDLWFRLAERRGRPALPNAGALRPDQEWPAPPTGAWAGRVSRRRQDE